MNRINVVWMGVAGACMVLPLCVASAQSTDLPDELGKPLVIENCTSCHGVEVITAQRRSSEGWGEVLNRMVANGAALSEDQYTKILAYLATYLGTTAASEAVTGHGVANAAVPVTKLAPAVK